jgi:hypothetical protein
LGRQPVRRVTVRDWRAKRRSPAYVIVSRARAVLRGTVSVSVNFRLCALAKARAVRRRPWVVPLHGAVTLPFAWVATVPLIRRRVAVCQTPVILRFGDRRVVAGGWGAGESGGGLVVVSAGCGEHVPSGARIQLAGRPPR